MKQISLLNKETPYKKINKNYNNNKIIDNENTMLSELG